MELLNRQLDIWTGAQGQVGYLDRGLGSVERVPESASPDETNRKSLCSARGKWVKDRTRRNPSLLGGLIKK